MSLSSHATIKRKINSPVLQIAAKTTAFLLLYLIFTFSIVPVCAKMLGRVRLPLLENAHVKPVNILTCLLNRNYVRRELRQVTFDIAAKMHEQDSAFVLCYLDANFPFINRFPLMPHLSHNDGKKLDVAFAYRNAGDNTLTNSSPSFIGYGVSEEPIEEEENRASFCDSCGYWQYGFLNKVVPQSSRGQFRFDGQLTYKLVKLFAEDERIGKIFIEPHLKKRLHLEQYDKIRFQGCHSVRHDDHIHVQLK